MNKLSIIPFNVMAKIHESGKRSSAFKMKFDYAELV